MCYKQSIVLCLATLFVVTGCSVPPLYTQTQENVAEVAQRSKDAFVKSDNSANTLPPLVINQGLYVDQTPISLSREPSWMRNHIVIRGDNMPFSYYSRTIVSNMGRNILTRYQGGLDDKVTLSINYSGTVKGAMDLLASKAGYVYTVNNSNVYWQAFITKTYDIAFMPGSADYTLGDASSTSGGSGGGSAGGSSSGGLSGLGSSSSLKGTISVWKDLETTIQSLLSADGKVIVSQSTTTVTVRDRPMNISLVSQYIHNLNKNLSKQVLVKVQIYEVTLNSAFNYGIDWSVVKRGFLGTNFTLNGDYGTPISVTPIAGSATALSRGSFTLPAPPGGYPQLGVVNADQTHITGVNLLVSALQQQGKVSVVSEPRVVALNNQVSVISIVNKQAYAASVSSSTIGGGVGSTTVTAQITPGTLVTGLILYILPKILGDKVYLQVSADLSSQVGTITSFTSGGSSIQVPQTTEKEFNQRSVIGSNDTLILSGFRQVSNTANAAQLFDSQALGGRGASQTNSETVVLITPIILNGTV